MFLAEIIVALAIIASDLILKNIAATVIANTADKSVTLIPGFFSLTYTGNPGGPWGILSNATWVLAVISLLASVAFIVFLFRTKNKNRFMRMSVTLLLAGAVGNLYDRMFLGDVRDMLRFDFFDFPIFNIADSAIVIGVILLLIYVIFIYKEPTKVEKADAEKQDDSTDVMASLEDKTNSQNTDSLDGTKDNKYGENNENRQS